ncbi:cell division protein FtsH, partial [Amycolatopsis sp. SID8362]|nr:cell division protein FtsH [Amycolatopsis sp. SID8362]NED47210.1 cell division protein FtsH [Amycolatopsis sp. SID8362]
GTAHWPQSYGGQQPGGYPGGPAGGQSGPPNYGAPPGWTPATSPGGQPGQSWRPGGEERPREHGWFADQAGNQQSEGERRDVDGPDNKPQ